jgi:hypothetical protein
MSYSLDRQKSASLTALLEKKKHWKYVNNNEYNLIHLFWFTADVEYEWKNMLCKLGEREQAHYRCTTTMMAHPEQLCSFSPPREKMGMRLPWRSVHPRTLRPKRSVHLTNHLLWQFATVTFRLKVDGLSVHPKLWQSDLVNLDSLSQCDKSSHCNFFPKSVTFCPLFLSNFAATFHPNETKGLFFQKICPFLLTFTCDNWPFKGRVWAQW